MQEKQLIINLYKEEGETPLQCLNRFRSENVLYKDAVLSYVGRLDPMAEGMLLVVADEENKQREKYLVRDKVYEIEILFGVATDTGDILGVVTDFSHSLINEVVGGVVSSFVGKQSAPYPTYSSKAVNGKSLFEWAREGRLNEIEIPVKHFEIYDIKQTKDIYQLTYQEILKQVKERVGKVKGDFRQDEIINSWDNPPSPPYQGGRDTSFYILPLTVSCSSGTYMRTLAENIARKFGTVGLAWRIKRISI